MSRVSLSGEPPESLRRRGLSAAVEVLPGPGNHRVRDAGRQLASLFGAELRERLVERARIREEQRA